MTMTRAKIITCLFLLAVTTTPAIASNAEIRRLEQERNARIGRCSSLECREFYRSKYNASINSLRTNPSAYYDAQDSKRMRRETQLDMRRAVREEMEAQRHRGY